MQGKRILILTASIGSGHIKAAEAVAAELRRQQPDVGLTMIDFMSRKISILHWLMKKIYLVMLALIPNIYDLCYKASGGASGGTLVQKAFACVMLPAMRRLVKKYRPGLLPGWSKDQETIQKNKTGADRPVWRK